MSETTLPGIGPVMGPKRAFTNFVAVLALVTAMAAAGQTSEKVYDITEHGAVGDGETLCTEAINAGVTECAQGGGGTVRIPPGHYLSGTIELKSNVTLKLAQGATIVGTKELDRYRYLNPDNGSISKGTEHRWHRALIVASGVENVELVGPGFIDGRHVYDRNGEANMRGPHTVIIGDSRNITVRNLNIKRSGNYALFFRGCRNVVVRHTGVTGGWDAVHFRDFDGRSNRNLAIRHCRFFTGDDCIAGEYVENLHIEDTALNTSCNGIRIIGPVQGMTVRDCDFYGPGEYPHIPQNRHNMLAGILLQPGAWGPAPGPLRDVTISNITMKNVSAPISVWLKREDNTVDNIHVSNMVATGVYKAAATVESWTQEAIGEVSFKDIRLQFRGGGEIMENHAASRPHVGARAMPAWGLFAKNVEKLEVENAQLTTNLGDPRPTAIFRNVDDLTLDRVAVPQTALTRANEQVVYEDVGERRVTDSASAFTSDN